MIDDIEFILISDKLPEKGKDILGVDSNNEHHYCFRCSCKNYNCKEWRCSFTDYHLMIDIIKWKYV